MTNAELRSRCIEAVDALPPMASATAIWRYVRGDPILSKAPTWWERRLDRFRQPSLERVTRMLGELEDAGVISTTAEPDGRFLCASRKVDRELDRLFAAMDRMVAELDRAEDEAEATRARPDVAAPDLEAIANDPGAADWLRAAARSCLAVDPVDAYGGAETLARACRDRADRALVRHAPLRAPVACRDCLYFENVSPGSELWYHHLCLQVPRAVAPDPYDGKLKPRDAEHAFAWCRDVNRDGDCHLFTQRGTRSHDSAPECC